VVGYAPLEDDRAGDAEAFLVVCAVHVTSRMVRVTLGVARRTRMGSHGPGAAGARTARPSDARIVHVHV